MAKRPTRLRFTEDDLADSHVKKAADRADKAVDRAEKAADKLASKKAKPKLKLETDAAGSRKAKLRFEKWITSITPYTKATIPNPRSAGPAFLVNASLSLHFL